MSGVLYAVIALGALGAVFGLLLAYASKVFAVEVDERQEKIAGLLPGANCGGCGYAGCSAYAAAVVNDGATVNKCAPGGSEAAEKIAGIMGVSADKVERQAAFVRCAGSQGHVEKKFEYSGIPDCHAAMRLGGGQGPNQCPNGCIGVGSCVSVCRFDALHIVDGIAKVDREKCAGCQTCLAACPKNLITMTPYDAPVMVSCANTQKGAQVRKYCDTGCIGCKLCEKACQSGAIKVEQDLAIIDYSLCTGCGACAEKCPRKIIHTAGDEAAAG